VLNRHYGRKDAVERKVVNVLGRKCLTNARRNLQPARSVVVMCGAAVLLVGCDNADKRTTPPSPIGAPSAASPSQPITTVPPSASPNSVEATVLAAYTGFWRVLPEAAAATEDSGRLRILVPVTTDPEISQLISNLAAQRAAGKTLYGAALPRPAVPQVDGDTASVADCQDASQSGVADVSTGRKETVGVARNPVRTTLKKRGDVWKVATVEFPAGATC
jgi:hypothetical protein